eukprot:1064204-Ditylum_brightwellii.AAC.1
MNAIAYAVNEEIERIMREAIEAASAVADAANMIRLEELAAKEDEINHYKNEALYAVNAIASEAGA